MQNSSLKETADPLTICLALCNSYVNVENQRCDKYLQGYHAVSMAPKLTFRREFQLALEDFQHSI